MEKEGRRLNPPIYYDYANQLYNAETPTGTHPRDNLTTAYYVRYLLKRAMAMFKFTLPEAWDENYFKYVLFCWGYLCVINSPRFGVIPQQCTLSGYNVFYRPAYTLVTNPLMTGGNGNGRYKIGSKTELICLQPDFSGILDICTLHAERLAYIHEALIMNLQNSKLAYLFLTDDKAAAQLFKAAIDQVQQGQIAVAAGSKLKDKKTGELRYQFINNDIRSNFIAGELLDAMRVEFSNFDSKLGIPNVAYEKKERINTAEANMSRFESETLLDTMYTTMSSGIDKVNKMFGLSLRAEKRYETGVDYQGEEAQNGED